MRTSRRTFVKVATGAVAAASLPAWAYPVSSDIDAFARGVTPAETGLSLDIAPSVENGAYVSVAIEADSAMSGDDLVETILLVAPGNPRAKVAEFDFGPLSGRARLATRMRLAKSQEVLALARMRDGSVRIARQTVTVVVGGCDI